jgi:metallo-beta-lactamase family protein
MWQGWSSVRYIQYALQNAKSHIRFTWYQAQGTLGKELLDKYQTGQKIKDWERELPIRATINQLKSFSSHADESELVDYVDSLAKRSHHHTIITHWWEQRFDLKQALQEKVERGTYTVPELFDTVTIDTVKKKVVYNPKK